MSESLKNNLENNVSSVENRWETLNTVEFKGNTEREKPTAKKSEHLAVLKVEKPLTPVSELSLEDASKEYLKLLQELSNNFTSPEGKTSRVGGDMENLGHLHYSGGGAATGGDIVKNVLKTATGEDIDRQEREIRDAKNIKAGSVIDRRMSMNMADAIISAESDWRSAGETPEATIKAEQNAKAREVADAKAKLEKFEHGFGGKIRKTLFKRRHQGLQVELHNAENRPTPTERATKEANAKLSKALEAAYSEDYNYGHHRLSYDHSRDRGYQERVNEDYNNIFFSEERKQKIDRAIELRRRLEAEKVIK